MSVFIGELLLLVPYSAFMVPGTSVLNLDRKRNKWLHGVYFTYQIMKQHVAFMGKIATGTVCELLWNKDVPHEIETYMYANFCVETT
jgi:hypothetical protein